MMPHHPLADDVELRGPEPWQAAVFAAPIERRREYLVAWPPIPLVVSDVEHAGRGLVTTAATAMIDRALSPRGCGGGPRPAGR